MEDTYSRGMNMHDDYGDELGQLGSKNNQHGVGRGVYQSASSVNSDTQAATGICDIDQLVQNFIDAEDRSQARVQLWIH